MHDLKLFHMKLSKTPPELSLCSLPLHRPEPSGLATPPPFRVPVAVPFIWEEEPGRPRKESILIKPNQKPFSARSLELPPRMVAEELKMKADRTNATSPTSVLHVTYSICRSRSFSRCYSFNTGNERSKGDKGEKNARESDAIWFQKEKRESKGACNSSISSCGCDESKGSRVKITRFKRHHSLIDVSMHATSHFLLGIYKSLRQVVPWHRT
ncbi:hypothetical protein FCM35_KLT06921 [Carex littledalei]|uniref:Uncharacterized protein n=1 Tax=Carex littledalei TaxID=544730 RepID=A0A833QKL1_9POAL|nr:hypothetical protein FCM35_KLT06921 [Carex littledalei]